MKFKIKNIIIDIEILVIVILILSCVFPKIRVYLANYIISYLFIMFHEAAHIFVASIFKIDVIKIRLTLCGVNAVLSENYKINIIWKLVYLAGPLSNLMLAILFKNIIFVRNINLALVIVNLIPIYPLDGFNILNNILLGITSKNKTKFILIIIKTFIILLFSFYIIFAIFVDKLNFSVIIFFVYILFLNKITCL